ncbi:MAG: sensor histidine kinase [Anaerolineae bacterium]|nr:sensor histidine kinase [Anaerolineae bacterium]
MNRLRLAGTGMYVLSSTIIALSMVGLLVPAMQGNLSYQIIMISVGILGIMMGVIVFEVQGRGDRTLALIDWQRGLRAALETVRYPLTSQDLARLGSLVAGLFENRQSWILLVNVPGLLLSGEVRRSKYMRVTSESWLPEFSPVESALKDEMERISGEMHTVTSINDSKAGIWINKRNEIAVGIMVILGDKEGKGFGPLEYQFVQAGVEEIVQYFDLLLSDLVRKRGALGREGPGLVVRYLTHEIAGELQGVLSKLDTYLRRQERRTPESIFYKVSSALWRVKYLLEQLRDAPVFEDGWLPINPEPVDLLDIVAEIIGEANHGWPEINFILETAGGVHIAVMADSHLRSIVRNLLFNAASFSPADGIVSIAVTLVKDGEFAILSIEDEGPGVTPEQADEIFEPLVTTCKQRDRLARRTGVGLAVARMIARAYGGDVIATSSTENEKSSQFIVSLPTAG